MGAEESPAGVVTGDGYSVAGDLDVLGEGPGFRKVRRDLGVEAFGVNAVIIPAGYESGFHFHDEQEELYFLHSGALEIEFGDGTVHRLDPGGMARVEPQVHRRFRNPGETDAVYICVGGKGGYVGRDGRVPDPENPDGAPIGS